MLVCVLSISCSGTVDVFVQGDIRIALPVQLQTNAMRELKDGGTRVLPIIDATGRRYEVFFDRRFSQTPGGDLVRAPGTIYLNGYPGKKESVLILNQNDFKRRVLKDLAVPVLKDTPDLE